MNFKINSQRYKNQNGRILTEYSIILLLVTFISISFFFIYGKKVKNKVIEIIEVLTEEEIIISNEKNNEINKSNADSK